MTERFRELQGLDSLIIGPACLVSFWSLPYADLLGQKGVGGVFLGLLLSFLPCLVALSSQPLLRAHYRERFGRVSGNLASDFTPRAVLLIAGMVIDLMTLGSGRPSATLVAWALVAAYVTVRDWPWRAYHLITVVACSAGAVLTAIAPAMHIDTLRDLMRVSFSILMATGMVTGYLDYRLLARALPRNPAVTNESAAEEVVSS